MTERIKLSASGIVTYSARALRIVTDAFLIRIALR